MTHIWKRDATMGAVNALNELFAQGEVEDKVLEYAEMFAERDDDAITREHVEKAASLVRSERKALSKFNKIFG